MSYKHDYDKILTRLNIIITRLNNGESLSVKELAEEFNVSTRTIQRDLNERLIPLYPIYQDKKKWKMKDNYKIEKSSNIEDTLVLDILENMANSLGNRFSNKAKSLLSKIKNEDFNPIYTKLNMEDISDNLNLIMQLENAIKNKKIIHCIYDFVTSKKEIDIKPLKIANYEGFWYLLALDARNDILKKYHIKSISNIKITDKSFNISQKLDELLENSINIWFDATNEAYEVQLYLDSIAAKILQRKPISKTQKTIKKYENGDLEISIKITHEMEILPIVKYWIPHIKIVSPIWLAEKLNDDVKKILQN
jgi:predicted DNA-binding transcriptional regulator YafY